MAEPIIDVRNLWTERGGQTIHRDLSMQVAAGEIIGMVGGSGSGKTTLLRAVIGLDASARGTVRLFGIDPLNAAVAVDSKRRIYAIDSGPCSGGQVGVAHVLDQTLTEVRTIPLGECAVGAVVVQIPPQ